MTFPRLSLYTIGYLLLVLGIVGAFVFVEYRREQAVNQLNLINYIQCLTDESLKKAERAEARERYRRLPETLDLLGIEETPQIRRRALMDMHRTLSSFAAKPCDRYLLE